MRVFATIGVWIVKTANKDPVKGPGKTSTAKQSGDQVSELTTNRLSVYLRCLNTLEDAGVRTISSQALAEQFHLNAAQIRKDLAYLASSASAASAITSRTSSVSCGRSSGSIASCASR